MSYTDREVRTYLQTHTQKQARQHFKISHSTICKIIGTARMRKPWHDTDVLMQDMRKFHNNVPLLAKYYGITASALYNRIRRYKVQGVRHAWTKKHDQYVAMNIHIMHVSDIAKKLKRTTRAVCERARQLGVSYNAALGLTATMLADELGVNTEHIASWIKLCKMPVEIHPSGRRSYDIEAVYNWLAQGHALRLPYPEKLNSELQAIVEQCKRDYIGSLELQAYGFVPSERTNVQALKPVCIGRVWGYGNVYPRAYVADHLMKWVPRLNQRALPGEDWYQGVLDRFAREYVTTQALQKLFGKEITGSLYTVGLPRPVYNGIHEKAAVIAWLHKTGRFPSAWEALQHG
jgi:transposase